MERLHTPKEGRSGVQNRYDNNTHTHSDFLATIGSLAACLLLPGMLLRQSSQRARAAVATHATERSANTISPGARERVAKVTRPLLLPPWTTTMHGRLASMGVKMLLLLLLTIGCKNANEFHDSRTPQTRGFRCKRPALGYFSTRPFQWNLFFCTRHLS